jgi:TRAP-type uncharacterized transport system fused permease subunit
LAAYALVAVLVAPTIVELGVLPMAAHLFVFYFAMVSSFTPPIALACFAAAPIAGASPHKIGLEASKLGIVAYIVPFLFIYTPALLISTEMNYGFLLPIIAVAKGVIAIAIFSVSVVGFYKKSIGLLNRIILGVMSLAILFPSKYFIFIISITICGTIFLIVNRLLSKRTENEKCEVSVSENQGLN